MVEKIDLSNFSSDVASNISSFVLGDPAYIRLKHNKALKRIQKKYKPYCTEVGEYECEDEMQRIVGRPEIKEIHTRHKVICYDLFIRKFHSDVSICHYIEEQKQRIKNMILKENQKLLDNGEYQYIKELSTGILRLYADKDNVPEHFQSIRNTYKTFEIKYMQRLDKELDKLFINKVLLELSFIRDYSHIEISSYRFIIGYEFEKIIYEENFRKRN